MNAVDVHGLPARWRKEAGAIREQSGYTGDMQFDYCADELEAALRQSGVAVLARGWFHRLPDGDYDFHDEASGAGKDCDGCIPCMIATAPPATSGLVELVRREIEAAKRELDTVTATDDAQSDGIGCAENALDRALAAIAVHGIEAPGADTSGWWRRCKTHGICSSRKPSRSARAMVRHGT